MAATHLQQTAFGNTTSTMPNDWNARNSNVSSIIKSQQHNPNVNEESGYQPLCDGPSSSGTAKNVG
jgi:hypothetical protein